MRRVAAIGLALQLTACTTRESNDVPTPACDNLFGRPNEKTGLDSTQCRPSCGCGDAGWVAPEWTAAKVDSLLSFKLLDAPAELTADPYKSPPPDSAGVCAVRIVDRAARTYRLESHATAAEATASGAIVTHENKCGLCSTLADLAVYATKPDLTDPVRSCGLDAAGNLEKNVSCLQKLGFTRPCAQIWAYNTLFTRNNCLGTCLSLLSAPYHEEDGGLNACLLCDEQKSGPVFKGIAGRTRRNTGVASAMCRPCSEVMRLEHDYDR